MKPIKCKDAAKLLQHARDRRLDFSERVQLKLHLAVCIHCRRYQKQLDILDSAMARYRESLEMPSEKFSKQDE
ncbi:zf-HC2 domain-containing protein [Neisseria chenwenguii]|uniref:Uncharacterized protein n=1 Tax=Neisseria chenwenguii TaxID=1853278 RepID=A0A220S3P3_9NEIS|nr:hypothetical protein [Neisseria chenwenguii]ASK28047.1 hypothetical protein BG910_10175 [Neisseria chenwenguii]ROV57198.1 zf-HC2 domain-containing protein [Neisseria chenwenguii]